MGSSRIETLLERQRGVVATWQILAAGGTHREVSHAIKRLRAVHSGVWLSGHAPLTDWQRWKAGTLTAPGRGLCLASSGALMGFRNDRGEPTRVVRAGSGGPQTTLAAPGELCGVTVHRRRDLSDMIEIDGISSMPAPRTVRELVAIAPPRIADRIVRDALRQRVVRPQELRDEVRARKGERGTAVLRALVERYGDLGLDRTASDAEGLALSILRDETRLGVWRSNLVLEGHEADLVRADLRLILEIDGPQFHLFSLRDAIKQASWERAGWVVRRLPSGDVYDAPERLIDQACRPVDEEERQVAARTRTEHDVLTRWRSGRP